MPRATNFAQKKFLPSQTSVTHHDPKWNWFWKSCGAAIDFSRNTPVERINGVAGTISGTRPTTTSTEFGIATRFDGSGYYIFGKEATYVPSTVLTAVAVGISDTWTGNYIRAIGNLWGAPGDATWSLEFFSGSYKFDIKINSTSYGAGYISSADGLPTLFVGRWKSGDYVQGYAYNIKTKILIGTAQSASTATGTIDTTRAGTSYGLIANTDTYGNEGNDPLFYSSMHHSWFTDFQIKQLLQDPFGPFVQPRRIIENKQAGIWRPRISVGRGK